MVDRVTEFDDFSQLMQDMLQHAANSGSGYIVSSANPRLVNGQPSRNPQYLQTRLDLPDPFPRYVAERGIRFAHLLPTRAPLLAPVGIVLLARRNNPPDPASGV
jgi:hypothetical protein